MMLLREYQIEALDAIDRAFTTFQSALVVMATGLGKTVVLSHVAKRRFQHRALVLAHRDELIRQAVEKLHAITGQIPGIEMGSERTDEDLVARPQVVVSSVQTMCRPNRRQRFWPRDFGTLIIDEAHHAVARTYRDTVAYFREGDLSQGIPGNPHLKVLGVTATPNRADELALGQIFQTVAYDYGIERAIENGYLVPVQQRAVRVEDLDFSRVRTVAADFNEGELDRILSQESMLHRVAAPTIEIAGSRSALVFCVTVNHARLMAAMLDRYKKGSAVALDGTTDMDTRRKVVDDFKSGKIQMLCNCGLFLEGFDAPNTAVVVMARPTKSLALYCQILGRGTRSLPGVIDGKATAEERRQAIAASAKPNMLILDFVGNSGTHKIISASDLLGGKYQEPIRQYARKTLEEEGEAVGVEESMERARDELALLAEIQERERRRALRARAEYVAVEVNPFAAAQTPPVVTTVVPVEYATDKQVWYLVRRAGWKEESARRLSKSAARAIIGKHKDAQHGPVAGAAS